MMYPDVTDLVRLIVNGWLRSFYSVKPCLKSEPPNLKSTAEIPCFKILQNVHICYPIMSWCPLIFILRHSTWRYHSTFETTKHQPICSINSANLLSPLYIIYKLELKYF